MTPTDDETRRQLEAAKLRAAETAKALAGAPRAQYPGMPSPAQAGTPMPPPVNAQRAADWGAAQAKPAGPRPYDPATATPEEQANWDRNTSRAIAQLHAERNAQHTQGQAGESATPGIDAVLAVNKRAADRATADAGRNVEDMAAQRKRRERLRGELMQASLKLANPNASQLELDMARRRR